MTPTGPSTAYRMSWKSTLARLPLASAGRSVDLGADDGGPYRRDLVVRQGGHDAFAGHGGGDEGRQLLRLTDFALGDLRLELAHHLGGEQLQRLADVLMAVAAGLL